MTSSHDPGNWSPEHRPVVPIPLIQPRMQYVYLSVPALTCQSVWNWSEAIVPLLPHWRYQLAAPAYTLLVLPGFWCGSSCILLPPHPTNTPQLGARIYP